MDVVIWYVIWPVYWLICALMLPFAGVLRLLGMPDTASNLRAGVRFLNPVFHKPGRWRHDE